MSCSGLANVRHVELMLIVGRYPSKAVSTWSFWLSWSRFVKYWGWHVWIRFSQNVNFISLAGGVIFSTTLANFTASLGRFGAASPPPAPVYVRKPQRFKVEKEVCILSCLVLFFHPMRNTVPGCLKMIDDSCKYGHYHKGNSHLHYHYSLSAGDIRSP